MADIKTVLARLNKNRKEEDKIKLNKDLPKNYYTKKTTSTGSPFIDSITGGGYAKGGFNLIIAEGGVGKSSLALLAIKHEYESTGRIGIYFDGEGTFNDSYMERMGVTRDMFVYVPGRNLESMLDTAEAFSTADDVGIIIIDSIPIYVSSVVEDKSAEDNNMAVEARKYTARMPIIEGNCFNRDITLIGLTHYKKDPGKTMGDNRYLSRGNWQITMSNLRLNLTKGKLIPGPRGTIIGNILNVRVKKCKLAPYDKSKVYETNFYYDGGFDSVDEYVGVFVENGVIDKGGAWFTFADQNGEEIKLQGKNSVIDFLKNDLDAFEVLKERLYG